MTIQQLEEKLTRRLDSPLFAYLANEYLNAGRVDDAKTLCQSGLARYPSYATAHLILAKCYVTEGDFLSAVSAIQDIKSLGPDSPLVENFYQQCLLHIVAAPRTYTTADLIHTADSSIPTDNSTSSDVATLDEIPLRHSEPAHVKESTSVTVPLAELSAEERTQIQPTGIDDEKRIVSRTLAEIYASQREFGEAILTYQLLKRHQPENTAEFDERIQELEVLLQQKLAEEQRAQ
ncbi:MAG: tetratricopeptide repeat protein [Ignavibacteriae bacterium]|nr:tetratricopeptide repeat protein [Ignavibacteria bacterium]MBI3364012.1 tetratricopeptide repeat protein [Ignavibacteriota bacterium]